MMSSLFICVGILSSWLMFFSILLLYVIKLDSSFNFVIENKWQHRKHWISIVVIMAVGFYILFLRIKRMGISINIYSLWDLLVEVISKLSWSELFLTIIILFLFLIFIILVFRYIYLYLKKSLLALYLYYYTFGFFRGLCSKQIRIFTKFNYWFMRFVKKFTNNRYIINRSFSVWPMGFYFFESWMIRFILPYLFIFDWITQDGVISKIFIVFPWYYVYMLMRSFWLLMDSFFGGEFTDISRSIYKSAIGFDGNTHRWVSLMEFSDSYYKEEEYEEAEFKDIESEKNKPAE